jgi:hypothetical protein
LGHLLKDVVGSEPILLVLDDVWPDSEGLVEKFKFKMSDYKILVTSRVAFRRFGPPCQLDPLDHDHAVSLFQHYAQLNESSSYMPDKNLLDEVLSLQSNYIDKQDINLCFFFMLNLLVCDMNKLFMNNNNLICFK